MSIAHSIQELIDFTTKHLRSGGPPDIEVIYINGDRSAQRLTGPGRGIRYAQAYERVDNVTTTVITLDGRVLHDTYFNRHNAGRYPRTQQ